MHQKGESLFPFSQIAEEIKALHTDVEKVAFSKTISTNFTKTDTIQTFEIVWKNSVPSKAKSSENKKLENWLRKKLKDESVVVIK